MRIERWRKAEAAAQLPDSGEVPGEDRAGAHSVEVRRVPKAKGLNTKQLSPHMENGQEPGPVPQPTLRALPEAEKEGGTAAY